MRSGRTPTQSLTRARIFALLLGLAGLFLILGGDTGLPIPRNIGDAIALLAGIVWAFGSLRVRGAQQVDTFQTVFSFFFYGTIAAVLIAVVSVQSGAPRPDRDVLVPLIPLLVLASVAFMIPVMWGILWGSKHIDPGRLGILLQLEAIIGIGSAALLTDEPFGLIEGLGTLLVVGAGATDVLGERRAGTRPDDARQTDTG